MGYHLITCIIENGRANSIIDEALKKGAQAATVFQARGRGINEKLGLFGRFIRPEKEVILIVASSDQLDEIMKTVAAKAELHDTGKGFAFIQSVESVFGFLQTKPVPVEPRR